MTCYSILWQCVSQRLHLLIILWVHSVCQLPSYDVHHSKIVIKAGLSSPRITQDNHTICIAA